MTPGDRDAYPTSTTFSAGDDFTFTPDGKYLVFTAVPEGGRSLEHELRPLPRRHRQPAASWECLTKDNPAADGGPRFSPDGKWLAYRAQKKPGYEADRWEIMIADVRSPSGSL